MIINLTSRHGSVVVLGLVLAMQAVGVQAAVYQYEMGLEPSDPWYSANGSASMHKENGGFGNGDIVAKTIDYAAPRYAGFHTGCRGPAGTARVVDSSGEPNSGSLGGNDGYYNAVAFTGPFTVDLRVFPEQSLAGGNPQSLSIRAANGNMRGLAINPGTTGGNSLRLNFINGTNMVGSYVDIPDNPNGDHSQADGRGFHTIRLVVGKDGGNNVDVFDLEDPNRTDTPLYSQSLGGSGTWLPYAGFGIGTLNGSNTASARYLLDFVRIDDGTALLGTADVIARGGEPEVPNVPCPCGSSVTPAGTQSVSGFQDGLPYPIATIDLGSPVVSNGMTHPICCDGMTAATVIGGRNCRMNVTPGTDGYFYFAVDDSVAFQGSYAAVTISFDYYDSGSGDFALNYDGAGSEWSTAATTVPLTDTNTWKQGSFTITDAYFGNREHAGSDFRIAGPAVVRGGCNHC